MSDLTVVAAGDSAALRYEVAFDEYVPLDVRSSSEPIGAGFLSLGDHSLSLLELAIEPRTQRLRGATLTSLAAFDAWPSIWVTGSHVGPPILGTDFDAYRVKELDILFKVAIGEDGIVVFWGALNDCTAYDCGRVRFLAQAGVLAGIWCTGVTAAERKLFLTAAGVRA